MEIHFSPIAFLYLLFFIYLFFSFIMLLYSWYKVLLN